MGTQRGRVAATKSKRAIKREAAKQAAEAHLVGMITDRILKVQDCPSIYAFNGEHIWVARSHGTGRQVCKNCQFERYV